jgi:hypothetical protein
MRAAQRRRGAERGKKCRYQPLAHLAECSPHPSWGACGT